MSNERKEFEKWAVSESLPTQPLSNDLHAYENNYTQSAWGAWKVRGEAAHKALDDLLVENRRLWGVIEKAKSENTALAETVNLATSLMSEIQPQKPDNESRLLSIIENLVKK